MKYVFASLLVLALVLVASMLFAKPLVLMSAMEGRLVDASGEPAAGIRLVRDWNWAWRNQKGQDETTTDGNGVFRFPAVTGRSLTARLLPHEPDTYQTITAFPADGPIDIWVASKRNYQDNGELQGRPLRVVCGLASVPGAESQRLFASLCIETQ